MENNNELSFKGLKDMKKNDYTKLFKKPVNWKKASAVLFLAKHKFSNGKMNLVAIPYRKATEANKIFKQEVKKAEGGYTSKLTLLSTLEKVQDDKGNINYTITPLQGGMNLDFLQTYGKDLFKKLKVGFEVVGAEAMNIDDLEEVTEAAGEMLSNKKSSKITNKQAKRAAKADKIASNLSKFEKIIGKVAPDQLEDKLATYEQVLVDMQAEAQVDGEITVDEQQQLDDLTQKISTTKVLVVKVKEATTIAENIQQIMADFQNL
jgi:hypothetical protein